ncbi:MAG: lamin tail domain-containing protein [Limisphaerales bacterium]
MNGRVVGGLCLAVLVGCVDPVEQARAQVRGSTAFARDLDVTGQGTDLGGRSDQCAFNYQVRTGDFDVETRVQSLTLSDVWAKAGLMARETLDATNRFVAALATPGLGGSLFEYRSTAGGVSAVTGTFPVNYPDTWLRLLRTADTFTGYASFDGQTWTRLGSVTLAFSNTVLLGVTVTSHNPAQPATAQFRSTTNTLGGTITDLPPANERLGPSSRKTGLVISEIMYKPAARPDGKNLEYLEVFNANPFLDDLSGYRLAGDIDYTFPAGTLIPGGGFLVVAKAPADMQSVYGLTNALGPYTNSLKSSGVVELRSKRDSVYLVVPYSNKPPWPVGADGTGHSLVLARPSYGEGNPQAWGASEMAGGSPGGLEPMRPDPLRAVVINEFLAHHHQGAAGFIELYNHSNQTVDLSGCWLTDDPATNKFQIPAGTSIAPRGFALFTKSQLNFGLSPKGVTLYFLDPVGARILDAAQFEPELEGVSIGRSPDGAAEFYPLVTSTPGAGNSAIRISDIVINEIMYAPISGDPDDQYVELYNRGTNAVNLGGWRFIAGIDFTFPTNTALPARGYLVLAKNAANLVAHYPNLNAANTLGDFQGNLSGKGDRLALAMPEEVITTDKSNQLVTNVVDVVVDEVTYGTGGRWGQWAHDGGSSLELIDPRADHRRANNWADSDETRKSGWVTIQTIGRLDIGAGTADSLQIIMLGGGECLVDDVAVINSTGSNVVANGSFEGGLTNWFPQGTHVRSSLDSSGGINDTKCLHVRASEEGDTGANRIRTRLTRALSNGEIATIRARVRWLHGFPEIVFRLKGNYLEATGNMLATQYFGTPGLRNSRSVANAGPAIYEVTHFPAVPAVSQHVVVTARVHDPDGVGSFLLRYRVDPSPNYATVPMVDDGTGGDAVAGDGVYSATIPGQPPGVVVAFYLAATDKFTPAATTFFPSDPPTRECLVRFGDPTPASAFGTYRLWLTQKTVSTWTRREVLSHEPLDGTFVYDNSRVVYNMSARYTGSPFHQGYNSPVGTALCQYTFQMPDDDAVLGTTTFNKQHVPGNTPGDDATIQTEQTAYWMARQLGLPWNYKRYVVMYVNGNRRGALMEDTQVPDGEVIKENFPNDTDGNLHKLYGWFEFADDGHTFDFDAWATLQNFTTTGGAKKLARYRWNWRARAVHGSANNFTNLYVLVDAANTPAAGPYVDNLERLVDTDEWMRTFALNHAVGNWDSYGNSNGQNMYAYKPPQGKWTMFIWDFNIVLGNSGTDGPSGDDIFKVGDPTIGRMYNTNVFRRNYLRVIKEIVDGPMVATNVNPVMDARYAAFKAEGLSVGSPTGVESWIATRRKYLITKLSVVTTNFVITSNAGADFDSSTNWVTLTGLAPVQVAAIKVNGIAYPITWLNVSTWRLNLPLEPGTNTLVLQGCDPAGSAVTNTTTAIRITFTGQTDLPQDHVVINEIMYHPPAPDAEFIELLNMSSKSAFDLSQWRFAGVDFTFPDATVIQPQGFVVVVKNRSAFATAYGVSVPVVGEFGGWLNPTGQTLALIKPGAAGGADTVINRVAFSNTAPWPAAADGSGASLQLIDPTQDNSRVANWAAVPTNRVDERWQFVTVTGAASSSRLYLYLTSAGDVYVDDLNLVAGPLPGGGPNLLTNGDFESTLRGPWTVSANLAQSAISTVVRHSGSASLHLVSTAGGTTRDSSVWEDAVPPLVTNAKYTLSYWYLPSTNGSSLTVRLSGSGIVSSHPIAPAALPALAQFTPGAPNSVRASLPPFPLLWLNEVQPAATTSPTPTVPAPWVELLNAGTGPINLAGWYLADNFNNTIQWAFPTNAVIDPGQFLVVRADGRVEAATTPELHASFRLAPGSGAVALSQLQSNQPVILDYLSYRLLRSDRSYGAFPDGQAAHRQVFAFPTPGAPNHNRFPPVNVSINEWMASNTRTLADPANGQFEDWFELYNADTNAVDLTDYTLTDNVTNLAQFVIPPGVVVPANGFLLVWADAAAGTNAPGKDLHVNFKLRKEGDAIALFAPDGAPVDAVGFGPQTADVSDGRSPDGASPPFQFMTTPTPGGPNLAPAPRLLGASFAPSGDVVFAWAARPGKSYRVQSTDDLSAANWLDLGTNVVASGAIVSFRDARVASRHRFYRVIQTD